MKARRGLALLLAGGLALSLPGCLLPPDAPTVLASAGGTGPQDAWFVYSPQQQQEIIRLLGLEQQARELRLIDGTAYEVFTLRHPTTGETREAWFDISRFFRRRMD